MNEVILYGNSTLSQMVLSDASGSNFIIVAFAVDRDYLNAATCCGLPQVDFADVESIYPPDRYDMLAVLGGYSDMRARITHYHKARDKGYRMRNYISQRADITNTVTMGENNIILGTTHVGLSGSMGDNNIIRQNVYLGHDFHIGDNCYIGPGCNIAGNCIIADTCYIGIGATVINNIILAEETLIGAGSVVIRGTQTYSKNVGNPTRVIIEHREVGIRRIANNGCDVH